MKIVYLSQYFPPEMGAPSARVHELSREWARLGHEVTVLTGFPHHPTGVIPQEYRGELFRRETVDGIAVIRAPTFATANRGVLRRALGYLSFSASASAVGPFALSRPDVLIATSPQLLTGLAGLWLAAALRVPFVFEVRDLWPRSIVAVGALPSGSLAVRALEVLERQLYRRADRVVVVAESFVDHLLESGAPREKISVVKNGVDLELFAPQDPLVARRALGLPEDGLLVSYVGTHGLAHGLGTLLETAAKCPEIRFLLVGEGAEKAALARQATERGLGNVTFWSQRDRSVVAQVLGASDLCLVLLRKQELFRGVLPSKLFECLGAGRPVVSTVDGEARALLEASGGGVFCPPEDPVALAATLRALASDPDRRRTLGASGRAWAIAHQGRPALARHYLEVLGSLVAS